MNSNQEKRLVNPGEFRNTVSNLIAFRRPIYSIGSILRSRITENREILYQDKIRLLELENSFLTKQVQGLSLELQEMKHSHEILQQEINAHRGQNEGNKGLNVDGRLAKIEEKLLTLCDTYTKERNQVYAAVGVKAANIQRPLWSPSELYLPSFQFEDSDKIQEDLSVEKIDAMGYSRKASLISCLERVPGPVSEVSGPSYACIDTDQEPLEPEVIEIDGPNDAQCKVLSSPNSQESPIRKTKTAKNSKQQAVVHEMDGYDGNLNMWMCVCGHQTSTKIGIKLHIKHKGMENGRYKCIHVNCEMRFAYPFLVRNHLVRDHKESIMPNKLFGCPNCGNIFFDRNNVETHRNERNEICKNSYRRPI